jgi:Uma2 family endonuclease
MAMPITVPRYTLADLERFPDDGNRYELLDGVLIVTPAPGERHEVAVARVTRAVQDALFEDGFGIVATHGAIQIPDHTNLEPDLIAYADDGGELGRPWTEPRRWWLAVEVLSRGSRIYDREWKRRAYLDIGVETVWIVDPQQKVVEVWGPDGERRLGLGETLRWAPSDHPDRAVTIELAALFDRI